MANSKSKASGGGAALLTLPEGYSTSPSRFYAAGVAHRFDTLPPGGGGTVRLLLLPRKGADDAEVRALLSSPRMSLKKKAPGVFEATLTLADMDARVGPNTGDGRLFRWVDLAHRCYGAQAPAEAEAVHVAVAYDGTDADAKKRLTALGATLVERKAPEGALEEDGGWVDPDAGLHTGTIPAGKIADLVMSAKVLSIEVRPSRVAEGD